MRTATKNARVWGSKKYQDPAAVQALAAESCDRCHCPKGIARPLAAAIAGGPRADGLRSLQVPTPGSTTNSWRQAAANGQHRSCPALDCCSSRTWAMIGPIRYGRRSAAQTRTHLAVMSISSAHETTGMIGRGAISLTGECLDDGAGAKIAGGATPGWRR
jgi:hypothetical protein